MSDKKKSSFGKTVLFSVVAFIVGVAIGFGGVIEYVNLSNTSSHSHSGDVVVSGELSIHFLELGNNYTGDSIYVRAGENDILIDAGSRQNSSTAIAEYVNTYCTDGKLEYVIATHAHQDHIAGFVGSKANPGIFARYKCGTIIDFAMTDATTAVYSNYITLRDKEVASDGATHYTALQCYKELDGAKRVYDLGSGITMEILYNYFYENKSGDENNYSVCVMFKHGSSNFLLTGDLEKEGETKLVEYNDLPEVKLYKAGHHGSYTASNDALLSVIKPEIVCVCCCAGSVEYTQETANTFPSQAFIDRVAPYTDKVFVTTVGTVEFSAEKDKYVDTGYSSLNGTIVVSSSSSGVTVKCSFSDVILKDSDWFKANRKTPAAWASN